ncbi:MAG TPA: conjugal transfer protein TraR [Ignavibacteriales bacterium]|nr:conjugal transfer protein TraR [Ignavibacteriales bacterium]
MAVKKTTKSQVKKTAVKKSEPKTKKTVKVKTITKKETEKKLMTKPTKIEKPEKTEKAEHIEKKKITAKDAQPEVEVVSPKKNVKKVKGYSKQDLEYFKKLILDKRTEILEQMQNLKDQMMDPSTGQYVNENSPYSLHMAEQGTDSIEREKLFLWAQRENKFLGYLEGALQRIDNGTYGICIECIDEPQHLCPTCPLIPKDRLAAVPHTQLCMQVKAKQEKK